jgi:YVTN family beta-propeller protein
VVQPVESRERPALGGGDSGFGGGSISPAKQQPRPPVLAAEQPPQIAVDVRRRNAGKQGHHVGQEVPQLPERRPIPPRALPIDGGESLVSDDDAPAAEVVVLKHGIEERRLWKRDRHGRVSRSRRREVYETAPLRAEPLYWRPRDRRELEDPVDYALDEAQRWPRLAARQAGRTGSIVFRMRRLRRGFGGGYRRAAALLGTLGLVAGGLLHIVAGTAAVTGVSPVQIGHNQPANGHFEYVFVDHAIDIYDIDNRNRFVREISLPQIAVVRGAVVSPTTGMLYVSYGGQGGSHGSGSLLAYDLGKGRVVWDRHYSTGVDSMAITTNGRVIYMPAGEFSGSGTWSIVDAVTGNVTGSVEAGRGAHNTIVGLDGRFVYLAGVDTPYLTVASTATNRVVRRIGPLKSGGRPFTINGRQTLAYTTAAGFLGFQVSSIRTGKVLYTMRFPGFSYDPKTFPRHAPCHGIALSPDERRLYVIDAPNGYVHVFDVSHVPSAPPRPVANVKLAHKPDRGWLQMSRDGDYLYVGDSGDVIDTTTLAVVQTITPLQWTAQSLEVDWQGGRVVGTTSRYALGYVRSRSRP